MGVVVTRMQDLAYEFSQKVSGVISRTLTAEGGDPLPHPHGRAQAPWCWDPNLGPPQHFSRGCAPALVDCWWLI